MKNMEKDTLHTIQRAEHFQVILIGEGLLVGAVAGLVVLLYRVLLGQAGAWLPQILAWAKGSPLRMAGWFIALAALAWIVARLVDWEPMISGSGIPQLEGEMAGKLDPVWYKVLPAKFIGGFLSLLGGLALGREGPSIQLGAMAGKGISRKLNRGKTEERFLLTCGASAGLAAAFHAPLAGVMFSLEEVHKNFSAAALVSVMTASLTADYISAGFLGTESVFQFDIGNVLPQRYYWMIVVLGLILGALGAFYNWFTVYAQSLYGKLGRIGTTGKLLIPFLLAGVLGFVMPEVLGSGHNLVETITDHRYTLGMAALILVIRFLFSAASFGSGAPGGIFFPLLVLGAYLGGLFGMAGVQYFGLDPDFINNFVLLAMAGYFSAIVRAPLTGIILIFEMTGSLSQLLSLSLISIVAYITADLLHSKPIYESLLERLLARQGAQEQPEGGEKVLAQFPVMYGSALEDRPVREIDWPQNCLLVAIQRGGEELIPKGDTVLRPGDVIIAMTDEHDNAGVHDRMEELCRGL